MTAQDHAIPLLDLCPPQDDLLGEVLAGLRTDPPTLPCKLLYDRAGSDLFDRICALPEYYPTRTELSIMRAHAGAMADAIGSDALLIELGSGSSRKTRLLLDALDAPAAYVPIDISRDHLLDSAQQLQDEFPDVPVLPLCADYQRRLRLPEPPRPARRRVIYFPGSTIGNFHPQEAGLFLRRMAQVAGPGGGLLIGVDLRKSPDLLVPAYDDAQGVTAAFNRNVLRRLRDEWDASVDLDAFTHRAVWRSTHGRMEMRLVAERSTVLEVAGETFTFAAGDYIHSESSYKYTLEGFADVAHDWTVRRIWLDAKRWFSVQYLTVSDAV